MLSLTTCPWRSSWPRPGVCVLSPEQLLARLSKRLDLLKAGRGVDPRQQTLWATIEWSYDLLDQNEQRLFACLSVFDGGCTLEGAEEVCQADIDAIQSLVDKSLVSRQGERFSMLETVREFAAEQLRRRGDSAPLADRQADYLIGLAELGGQGAPDEDPEQGRALYPELSNVRLVVPVAAGHAAGRKVSTVAAAVLRCLAPRRAKADSHHATQRR